MVLAGNAQMEVMHQRSPARTLAPNSFRSILSESGTIQLISSLFFTLENLGHTITEEGVWL